MRAMQGSGQLNFVVGPFERKKGERLYIHKLKAIVPTYPKLFSSEQLVDKGQHLHSAYEGRKEVEMNQGWP